MLDRTVRVAEGERARIAANLHDGPIQRLAALGLVLDRCRLRLDRDDDEGARELMKRARNELSEEIHNLREMMSELRPPILDEGGLDAALRDQLSSWTATTGVETRFEEARTALSLRQRDGCLPGRPGGSDQCRQTRPRQPGHSFDRPVGQGLGVVVWDNGKGFNPGTQHEMLRNGHFGLVVMRERVERRAASRSRAPPDRHSGDRLATDHFNERADGGRVKGLRERAHLGTIDGRPCEPRQDAAGCRGRRRRRAGRGAGRPFHRRGLRGDAA